MSLILNKTTDTFHHNKKSLLSVRCNSNSDGGFRGSHEASSEKGSATRTTWRSIDINISMRFNINIFKQHDQQQARVQAQQAGIAITNLITFKCLNIVLCIGGQQSIKLRSDRIIQRSQKMYLLFMNSCNLPVGIFGKWQTLSRRLSI